MDTLISFLLIAFVVGRLFSKGKKTKNRQKTTRVGEVYKTVQTMFGMEEESTSARTPQSARAVPSKPVRNTVTESSMPRPQRMESMEGHGVQSIFQSQLGNSSAEGKSRYGTARAGSLKDVSTEGMDLCEPSLGHDDHSTDCELHEVMELLDDFEEDRAPSLNLEWNKDTLVRAVVMNEILTRPSERMIRRG